MFRKQFLVVIGLCLMLCGCAKEEVISEVSVSVAEPESSEEDNIYVPETFEGTPNAANIRYIVMKTDEWQMRFSFNWFKVEEGYIIRNGNIEIQDSEGNITVFDPLHATVIDDTVYWSNGGTLYKTNDFSGSLALLELLIGDFTDPNGFMIPVEKTMEGKSCITYEGAVWDFDFEEPPDGFRSFQVEAICFYSDKLNYEITTDTASAIEAPYNFFDFIVND